MKPVKNRKERIIAYAKFVISLVISSALFSLGLFLANTVPDFIPKESNIDKKLLTNPPLDTWIERQARKEKCHYIVDAIKKGILRNGCRLTRFAVAENYDMIKELLERIAESNTTIYWRKSDENKKMRFFYLKTEPQKLRLKLGVQNMALMLATKMLVERFFLMKNDILLAEHVEAK